MLYSYEDDYRMITRAFQYIIIASYIFVGLISCFGILNMTNTLINSVLIRKRVCITSSRWNDKKATAKYAL